MPLLGRQHRNKNFRFIYTPLQPLCCYGHIQLSRFRGVIIRWCGVTLPGLFVWYRSASIPVRYLTSPFVLACVYPICFLSPAVLNDWPKASFPTVQSVLSGFSGGSLQPYCMCKERPGIIMVMTKYQYRYLYNRKWPDESRGQRIAKHQRQDPNQSAPFEVYAQG